MGVTQIDTQKVITEITDELVKKGLTNVKEIRIEPFAIGAYIHANVSVSFFENSTDSQNKPPENIELNMKRELDAFPITYRGHDMVEFAEWLTLNTNSTSIHGEYIYKNVRRVTKELLQLWKEQRTKI